MYINSYAFIKKHLPSVYWPQLSTGAGWYRIKIDAKTYIVVPNE
jgi:hypothetical protein